MTSAPLSAQQSAAAPKGGANAAPATLVFDRVTVVDVTDGRLRPGQTVVVAGTRIQAVGPAGKVRVPKGAQVVDARGKYLIPGLWDMHVHPGLGADLFDPLVSRFTHCSSRPPVLFFHSYFSPLILRWVKML